MKTNSYIYSFTIPNVNKNTTFLSSLEIVGTSAAKADEILNHLIDSAIKDGKKSGYSLEREDIVFSFISLVNTK